MNSKLLNGKQAMQYLGYKPSKFYRLVEEGGIPQLVIGKSAPRYSIAALDRLIATSVKRRKQQLTIQIKPQIPKDPNLIKAIEKLRSA